MTSKRVVNDVSSSSSEKLIRNQCIPWPIAYFDFSETNIKNRSVPSNHI